MEDKKSNVAKDILGLIPGVGGAIYGIGNAIFGKSQADMQAEQIKGAKEMADYNQQKAMEIWHNTNYGAQKKEMIAAGLNPGLAYGMSGGGGVTTNTAGSPMPTGQVAPTGVQQGQLGLEAAQTMANIKLMDSQAKKNEVEASKIGGVDTKLGETQIQTLTQGIENAKAVERLTRIQGDIADMDAGIIGSTLQDKINYIRHESVRMGGMAKSALSIGKVDESTIKQKIDLIEREIANKGADTILKEVQAKTGRAIATQEEFEAELRSLAIPENTPWYGKLIGGFLNIIGKPLPGGK